MTAKSRVHEVAHDGGKAMTIREAETRKGRSVEVVELRGGHVWELLTDSGERVVVDRGFVRNGGSIRDRWRIGPDGSWQRLFWVGTVDAGPSESHDGKRRLPVELGKRVELRTGLRDVCARSLRSWPCEKLDR